MVPDDAQAPEPGDTLTAYVVSELVVLEALLEELAWAVEGDCDAEHIRSNTFKLEWPPRSGTVQEFPEVDRAGWFPLDEAKRKINPAQAALLDELRTRVPS